MKNRLFILVGIAFLVIIIIGLAGIFTKNKETQHYDWQAKAGCCSHHGGVCGCSNGRTLCCDNTLSPTCKCE